MTSKELRAKRAKLVADARALMPTDRQPTAEENTKFDAMMVEVDQLKAQIDRIERAETLEAEQNEALRNRSRSNGTSPDEEREQIQAEEGAFGAWMRRGPGALNDAQRQIYARCFEAPQNGQADANAAGWRLAPRPRNALSVGTDGGGGYTVPQGFFAQLIDAQLAFGGMADPTVTNVIDTTGGNALPIPTDNDTSNKGAILGENLQTTSQDLTFGAITLNAYTYSSKLVLVSNQLLQDSAFNLDAFLSAKLGLRIARILNDHLTTGTGASQPSGIVGAAPMAATLGYTAGGSTSSGSTTSISFDDLIELEHSVDPAYRGPTARYMMADGTLKSIKKLKDGIGRPLWLPGLAVKEPDTINQFQYVINQSMPALGASNKSVSFGDFKNYFVRRVAGVQILRLTERYADFNQVGFLAFQRWDGSLVDAGTHPIKYLQNSAS